MFPEKSADADRQKINEQKRPTTLIFLEFFFTVHAGRNRVENCVDKKSNDSKVSVFYSRDKFSSLLAHLRKQQCDLPASRSLCPVFLVRFVLSLPAKSTRDN